ncbi:MAG: IPT/TIG domain-containing protein [bacterium]
MKNLSFVLALALICISIFSCEEKSLVSPLNEEFKISGISSSSGASGSTVTLYGKNLDCGSLTTILIGGKAAEILSCSGDSIVAIIPPLSVGSYTFKTQSKDGIKRYVSKYDILKVEPLKITNISSTSGYVNSQVILYGENLDNGIYLEFKFGDQTAEILQRTNDSIIVKVPKLAVGLYDIIVKTKLKPSVYESKYELKSIDFSQFNNYVVSISGLKLKFNTNHKFKDEINEGEGNWSDISSSYSKMYYNNYKLEFLSIVKGFYKWSENFSTQGKGVKNSISFSIDEFNSIIKSLHADFYESSGTSATYSSSSKHSSLNFDLTNIAFDITDNGSSLFIKLNKNDMITKMENFDTGWYSGYSEWQNHNRSSSDTITLLEILGINDNATIEIKFTK